MTDPLWVECPKCTKPPEAPQSPGVWALLGAGVVWCDLCCDCPEQFTLGYDGKRPTSMTASWHADRGNRPGYVKAGADVRYVLGNRESFLEYGERISAKIAALTALKVGQ